MTDRELLELAAKAAGIDGRYASLDEFPDWMTVHDGQGIYYTASQAWNPLTDDGEALRLAVKLGISLLPYPVYNENLRHSVIAKQRRRTDTMRVANPTDVIELCGDDPYAATRRAIVRAAAEIGKEKK